MSILKKAVKAKTVFCVSIVILFYTIITVFEPPYSVGQQAINLRRVGVNTHWYRWSGDTHDFQQKIRPFGFVRDGSIWSLLQHSKRELPHEWTWTTQNKDKKLLPCGRTPFQMAGYDDVVKNFQSPSAPELLLLLNVKNDKVASLDKISDNDYYQYVYAIVERYDGDGKDDMPGLLRPVRYFEVGNEVDYYWPDSESNAGMTPTEYVTKRLIPAYKAAKAANSSSVVMGAGLGMESSSDGGKVGYFNVDYLREMYKVIESNNGKANGFFMDKVAIHYYSKSLGQIKSQIISRKLKK